MLITIPVTNLITMYLNKPWQTTKMDLSNETKRIEKILID